MLKKRTKLFLIFGSIFAIILIMFLSKNLLNLDKTAQKNSAESEAQSFQEALKREDVLENFYSGYDLSFEKLKNQNKPIFLFFSWENCGPCHQVEPLVKKVKEQYPNIIVKYVEITHLSNFVSHFPIRVTPSFICLDNKGQSFEFSNDTLNSIQKTSRLVQYKDQSTQQKLTVYEGALTEEALDKMFLELSHQ